MAAAQNIDLNALFVDIHKTFNAGDYEKSARVCDKILSKFPGNKQAVECKIVCLINLDKYQDVLNLINETFKDEFQFEKAYCQYRLNQNNDALATLRHIPKPDQRCKELMGQILYKLEEYEECMGIYLELAGSIRDDYVNERTCNFLAVSTMLKRSKRFDVSDDIENRIRAMSQAESTCTYEQLYNISGWLIAIGDLPAAIACLQESESKIKSQLTDPDFTADPSLKGALCTVQTQLAYVQQIQGNSDVALKQYNEVFKQKPEDVATLAVVSNNIVTLHKDSDVFDSRKKLKVATSESARLKLTSEQFANILYNQALFSLITGQLDQTSESVATAEKRFSSELMNEERWLLLRATYLSRDKKVDEAISLLQGSPKTIRTQLALAQILISKLAFNEAIIALHSVAKEVDYSPGLVGALAALMEKQNRVSDASAILKEAIAFHKKRSNDSLCQCLLRAAANLNQRHGKFDSATEFLEQLRKDYLPNDRNVLAQLIAIYLRTNPAKAEKIGQSLPSLDEAAQSIDVASLENSVIGGGKIIKAKQPASAAPVKVSSSDASKPAKKKKNKKRKKPAIKNFIAGFVPDPERWLPKWQRSTYRGPKRRGQKGAVGIGTQGGTADNEAEHSLGVAANQQRGVGAQSVQPRSKPQHKKKK